MQFNQLMNTSSGAIFLGFDRDKPRKTQNIPKVNEVCIMKNEKLVTQNYIPFSAVFCFSRFSLVCLFIIETPDITLRTSFTRHLKINVNTNFQTRDTPKLE